MQRKRLPMRDSAKASQKEQVLLNSCSCKDCNALNEFEAGVIRVAMAKSEDPEDAIKYLIGL